MDLRRRWTIPIGRSGEATALGGRGRQLDGAPAIFPLVAPVRDAVGDRAEVICDGGIRRGSDIVKAVAAGADAAMAGRAYLYGLGAAGERGVDRVLGWFHADIERVMSLLGAATMEDLDREFPGYGFAQHKGYSTAAHAAALAALGPCREHRMSFAPVAMLVAQNSG